VRYEITQCGVVEGQCKCSKCCETNTNTFSNCCGREMASLHQAAKDGRLDQCRQLMEQKGKAGLNIDEKDVVNI
jgi:hypothetical protein